MLWAAVTVVVVKGAGVVGKGGQGLVGGGGVDDDVDGGPSDGGGGCREEKLWRWCHERVCRVLGTRGCVRVADTGGGRQAIF